MTVRRKWVVWSAAAALLGGGLSATAANAGAEVTGDGQRSDSSAEGCDAPDEAIYQPPADVPGEAGEVISCREVELEHVPGDIDMDAWKVQYSSTNSQGEPIAVSGTVAVPREEWQGSGSRPVVAFNPGTLGLGPQCAFSKQLAGEYQDMYEGDNIAESLKAGYAVAATDGAGYLDGETHPYMSGADAGNALLDIARAAPGVAGSGLDEKAKVGLWGYSEGGAASMWAAQRAQKYAPELDVAGVASGGVPGDLKIVADSLNGGAFAGFLGNAVVGLSAANPEMPFDELMNEEGRQNIAKMKEHCLAGTVTNFAGMRIEDQTKDELSLEELYEQSAPDGTTWGEVVDRQKLGVDVGPAGSGARHELDFPTFQYRGIAEEVIPTEAEDSVREGYCEGGVPTTWKTYPGEHLLTDRLAVDDTVSWLGERFEGEEAPDDCE